MDSWFAGQIGSQAANEGEKKENAQKKENTQKKENASVFLNLKLHTRVFRTNMM